MLTNNAIHTSIHVDANFTVVYNFTTMCHMISRHSILLW